jgi:hypothetical protein
MSHDGASIRAFRIECRDDGTVALHLYDGRDHHTMMFEPPKDDEPASISLAGNGLYAESVDGVRALLAELCGTERATK